MTDWQEYATFYIERLGGPDGENAFHSLIEADDAIVAILINAFRSEQDLDLRSQLVEIVWQHRLPNTTEFLAEALSDPVPEIWKSALDGLVTIGGQPAVRTLERAKQRAESEGKAGRVKIEWIIEAIEQIRD